MRVWVFLVTTLFVMSSVPVAAAPAGVSREDALVALCRIWNAVRFTHPGLSSESDARWDDALLAAEPLVERDPGALHAAAAAMLATLGDPVTTVDVSRPGAADALPSATERDGVHIAQLNGYPTVKSAEAYAKALSAALAVPGTDRALVVDLRVAGQPSFEQIDTIETVWSQTPLAARVASQPIRLPYLAGRSFLGFPTEAGTSSGQYSEKRETAGLPRVVAPSSDARAIPVAFVVDTNAYVPADALALQRAGRAALFSSDGSAGVLPGDGGLFDAGAGLTAALRTTAPLDSPPLRLGALDAAVAWSRDPKPGDAAVVPPVVGIGPDKRFADAALPDEAHRVLAAFRIWGTIEYLFPYKNLMHDDWDAALRGGLADLHGVTTPLEYDLALARMYAHIHDTHGFVQAAALHAAYAATPPFLARDVDGQPTIVRVDPLAAKRDGFAVGDVIDAVDGEAVTTRAARLRPYIVASTEQSARELLDTATGNVSLFAGPAGSSVVLRLRDASGRARDVRTSRVAALGTLRVRTRPVVEVLPGNVGYVDLQRLEPGGVDAMFKRLASTDAIVFDLRGYPRGTFYLLGPHLTNTTVPAALFHTPVSNAPQGLQVAHAGARFHPQTRDFEQLINPAPPYYSKPIVIIVDARAISQSEHTVLFLAASGHARTVGEPTMGANGDVTTFLVPGGVQLAFTGQAITHPDGSQLQRVGVIPDVAVHQSLRGLRAGEDELLLGGLREALRLRHASAPEAGRALAAEGVSERADALAQRQLPPPLALPGPGAPPLPDLFTASGEGFEGGHDPAVRHTDGRTIVLRGGPSVSGFGTYRETIPLEQYRGKRVRVSGYLRSEGITFGSFWLRVDGPAGVLAFDNMADHALVGTRDWTPFAIVLNVPAEASQLIGGLLLRGAGTLWADDLRIDVVDATIPTTG